MILLPLSWVPHTRERRFVVRLRDRCLQWTLLK
jgi:hypothetical protein